MEIRPNQQNALASEPLGKYDDLPGSTAREKLQYAHARLRATASAGPNPAVSGSVTPSSAGDIEPAPPVYLPKTTLPLSTRAHDDRADIPVPSDGHVNTVDVVVSPELLFSEEAGVQTIQPSAIFEKTENVLPGSLRLGPSEFAVTLPMDSRSKDEYEIVLAEHSQSVKLLLSGFKSAEGVIAPETEQAQTLSNVRGLVEKLDNIAVHTDLNIAAHVKRSSFESQKEASWAEYSSAKFQFLGQLIEVAGSQDLHMIIMVKRGESLELVKRYFQGKGFIPSRPQNETNGYFELSLQNGSISVGILSAQYDGIVETYRPPAIVLALDSSFNASSPSVAHLRTTYARHGNLLPVVHLLVSNSSEHIQRCLPDLPDRQRLKLLLHIVKSLQDFLGDLQDDAQGVQDNADEIFTYLMSDDFNASWNLPAIEPLHILVSDDSQAAEGPGVHATDPTSTASSSINKRIFDAMDTDTPDSKRQRLHMSQNLTQATESTAGLSQTLDLTAKLKVVEDRILELKAEHTAEVSQLQDTISELKARSEERVKGWEDLQHRYESRNKEFHKTRKERDDLVSEKAKAEQKVSRQQEEITKLKDERTRLKHDLESARDDIKAEGGLKEELEKAREENRQLGLEKAKLQKDFTYESNKAAYTLEQYQIASNKAATLATERNQLQTQVDDLNRRLAVEATKLREIRMKDDEQKHLARVKELEQTLEARDALIRRQDEELRNFRNNRPATRATSTQPRSPKSWGNRSRPTSPGVNNNGVGNRGSGLRFSSEMSL
ncbi:hypothetical protein UA08_00406 [Talaromyces atroroseus]|uniref:HDA1 complex subunit n=1 Tax=Talaromyces atroroseus TaxID=1441469 RepID=A0A225BBW8_TALAT|nr:hypothetical protein UA08_00406 [Talaromyces atroroseus]OKL64395.1 hypothetical protein UA08_00406 [Talaromyces atroroseus]